MDQPTNAKTDQDLNKIHHVAFIWTAVPLNLIISQHFTNTFLRTVSSLLFKNVCTLFSTTFF